MDEGPIVFSFTAVIVGVFLIGINIGHSYGYADSMCDLNNFGPKNVMQRWLNDGNKFEHVVFFKPENY